MDWFLNDKNLRQERAKGLTTECRPPNTNSHTSRTCAYQRVRNVCFSKKFAYVLNE